MKKEQADVEADLSGQLDMNGDPSINSDDNEDGPDGAEISTTKETSRVRTFRVLVLGMLVMTAAVVTTAYIFLDREENRNFETAVRVLVHKMTAPNRHKDTNSPHIL